MNTSKISAADFQVRKLHLIEWLTRVSDEKTVKELEELQKKRVIAEYERNLKPMTKAELIARAKRADEDIEAGRVISQEDLEKEMAGW